MALLVVFLAHDDSFADGNVMLWMEDYQMVVHFDISFSYLHTALTLR